MRNRLAAVYLRLTKYAMLMGLFGGIASFIGPPGNGLIKAAIGVVIGAMLLGNRLPSALKELRSVTDEISDEIFPPNKPFIYYNKRNFSLLMHLRTLLPLHITLILLWKS